MDKNLKYYNDEFFKMHIPWREDYDLIAKWINENVHGEIFGDIGCGNGYIIENLLNKYHKKVWGVDGSEHFLNNIDSSILPFVKRLNLTDKLNLNKADIAICLEVAEHIPPEFSDTLIQNIVSTEAKTILFTAAPLGQSGIDHINLQDPRFWITKLEEKGYYLDTVLSTKFQDDFLGCLKYTKWYLANWMVFRKEKLTSKEISQKNEQTERYLNTTSKQKIQNELVITGDVLNKSVSELNKKTLELNKITIKLKSLESETELFKAKNKEITHRIELIESEIESKNHELNIIYYSRGWRFVLYLRKLLNVVFPKNEIRRKVVAFCYLSSKKLVKNILKVRDFALGLVPRCKNYFKCFKRKKERCINLKAKKIVFIGHSYHKKTKSAEFMIEYLRNFFDVEVVYNESWLGKDSLDLSFIDEEYFAVIFWQLVPSKKSIQEIKNENIIYFPMFDDTGGLDFGFWNKYCDLKIINFSKTLDDKLRKWGFETMYIQYFPEPKEFAPGNKNEIFFWQRLSQININTVGKLFEKKGLKVHLHKTVDPGQEFILPNNATNKKFDITYSDWFENKNDILEIIKQKAIYIAPREFEGIGMSFLEAMAMGKVVVACDNPTMNEYIEHEKTGYLFDLKSIKPLDLSNVNEIQKNTYTYIQEGFKRWELDKKKIVDFIKHP